MRKIILYPFLLVILAMSSWGGEHDYDLAYWSQRGYKFAIGPITPEQAKQAIINWAGRQNLSIQLGEAFYWNRPEVGRIPSYGFDPAGGGGLSPDYISWYVFWVRDPNPDSKYTGAISVDSWTGEVKGIFKDLPARLGERNISGMLTPQQALNIAKQIATSYFPNIPIDTMEVDFYPDTTQDGTTWEQCGNRICVSFQTSIINSLGEKVEVKTQTVEVWIDSYTGELTEIFACYEPIEVSPVRSLTYEEIAQAVASFFYGMGAESIRISAVGPYHPPTGTVLNNIGEHAYWFISRGEPYGPQRLYTYVHWSVVLPSLSGTGTAYVDGHTGEIIYAPIVMAVGGAPEEIRKKESGVKPTFLLFFNGMKREPKNPPLFKGGQIYISVDDVSAMGFKVGRKGYVIGYMAKRAYLDEGDVINEKGKRYIKGKALEKLKGVVTNYTEEENQFHIIVLNEKLFKLGQEYRAKLREKNPEKP